MKTDDFAEFDDETELELWWELELEPTPGSAGGELELKLTADFLAEFEN